MLTFSGDTAVREEDFEVFPVLLQLFENSAFEVKTKIVKELSARGDGILLEELLVLDADFLKYLFVLFLFAGGLKSSISLRYKKGLPGLVDFGSGGNTIKPNKNHVLWADNLDEFLEVVKYSFIDLLKRQGFNLVP